MILVRKIMLLSDGLERSIEIECLLRVAGYSVTTMGNVKQAVNLSGLYRNTPEQFDMLIADVESDKQQFLIAAQRSGVIDKLLILHNGIDCRELYYLEGALGHCCHPSATLACIQELLRAETEIVTKPSK